MFSSIYDGEAAAAVLSLGMTYWESRRIHELCLQRSIRQGLSCSESFINETNSIGEPRIRFSLFDALL